jgi:hypothetical protein
MVEHTAVNRGVVGSSPTRGVKGKACKHQCLQAFLYKNIRNSAEVVKEKEDGKYS